MEVYLDKNAYLPTKSHDTDAGYDLYSTKNISLDPVDAVSIDTGVHLFIPKSYVGIIYPRSGLNVRQGITATGVIDAGYTGSIIVKLYRYVKSASKYEIKIGQRIAQIVVVPILYPDKLKIVNTYPESSRGNKGIGSSGL